jgi:hypothetical protein
VGVIKIDGEFRMRKRTIIILLTILIFIPATGNSSDIPQIKTYEDCVPVVGYIVDHKSKVSKNDLIQFFSSISNEHCLNNAEFNEYGNEILFSLIESNPLLFF